MSVKNKTINLYTEWKPLIDGLSNEEAGKLLKDIFQYQSDKEVFNTNPVWLFVKSKIDEYNMKGLQISEKRKENGRLGGLAKASKCCQKLANDSKSSNKIKENKIKENKINIFKKPTVDEIKDYCFERNNNVNAEKFYDFYESKGWKVGNQAMKDWKACVRTWESKNRTSWKTIESKTNAFDIFNQAMEEMERRVGNDKQTGI